MSGKGKKALGTVVECVEISEEASALLNSTDHVVSSSPPPSIAHLITDLSKVTIVNDETSSQHERSSPSGKVQRAAVAAPAADEANGNGMYRMNKTRKKNGGTGVATTITTTTRRRRATIGGSRFSLTSFLLFASSTRRNSSTTNQRSWSVLGEEVLRRRTSEQEEEVDEIVRINNNSAMTSGGSASGSNRSSRSVNDVRSSLAAATTTTTTTTSAINSTSFPNAYASINGDDLYLQSDDVDVDDANNDNHNDSNGDDDNDSHPNESESCERCSRGDCISSSSSILEGNNEQRHGYTTTTRQIQSSEANNMMISSQQQQQPTMRRIAQLCNQAGSTTGLKRMHECPLCSIRQPAGNFPKLTCCNHRSCRSCLVRYLQVEIMESRVQVACPECNELLHPTDIYSLMVHHPAIIDKYESFSLRRALMTDSDTRWCPAPDCTYAVIASNCAACPQLRCERPGCGTLFCYHCKGQWHASQTCDEARKERGGVFRAPVTQIATSPNIDNSLKRGDIKACPRCRTYIVKMNDGSCNHMVCAMCSTEFCWLCLKEINDLHYLSPTGCTFWGKKPWTKKKKLLWQVGTLIGAPVAIALIAGLAIPGIIFGVPVFVGRKVNQRFAHHSKIRRRLLTTSSVIGSLVVSPVLAVMAVGVGVPIMLAYVYGVVPLSLCRNGGCGVGAASSSSSTNLNDFNDDEIWHEVNPDEQEKLRLLNDVERQDGTGSVVTGLSINSGVSSAQQPHNRLHVQAEMCRRRPSIESGIMSLGEKYNYEEASTKAMAGSQYYDDKSVRTMYSGQEAVSYCEEIASTVALAGSVIDAKSLTDSASDRMVVTHLSSKDRDLSPTSHHAVTLNEVVNKNGGGGGGGDDTACTSSSYILQHNETNHIHCREDMAAASAAATTATCCGSCKRRARATSIASAGSGSRSHRLVVLPHSNSQQLVNLVLATNTEGDSDEVMLMTEDTVMHIANEHIKNHPSTSGSGTTTRSIHIDDAAGMSTSSQSGGGGSLVWGGAHVGDGGDQPHDRFHIRALFDAVKQLISDDVAVEPTTTTAAANIQLVSHLRASSNSAIRNVSRYSGSVKNIAQSTIDSTNGASDHLKASRNRIHLASGTSDQHRSSVIPSPTPVIATTTTTTTTVHSSEILHSSTSSNNPSSSSSNDERNSKKRNFFSNLLRRSQHH